MSKKIFHIFLLINFSFHSAIIIQEINQIVFLNPQTNSAFVRCPIDFTNGLDIQWYDGIKQQYDLERGRYYRINGLQPVDRELICSSIRKPEEYKFKIRTYGKKYILGRYSIEFLDISRSSITNSLYLDSRNNEY